jgi:hypothetical protein
MLKSNIRDLHNEVEKYAGWPSQCKHGIIVVRLAQLTFYAQHGFERRADLLGTEMIPRTERAP